MKYVLGINEKGSVFESVATIRNKTLQDVFLKENNQWLSDVKLPDWQNYW